MHQKAKDAARWIDIQPTDIESKTQRKARKIQIKTHKKTSPRILGEWIVFIESADMRVKTMRTGVHVGC